MTRRLADRVQEVTGQMQAVRANLERRMTASRVGEVPLTDPRVQAILNDLENDVERVVRRARTRLARLDEQEARRLQGSMA
jgi:hypothetical protein